MNSETHDYLTPAQRAAQDERAEEDFRHGSYEATQHTNLPLNGFMTRLVAEELPVLDSVSRQRVHDILRAYDGPEITTQEELPEEIIDLLDLR